MAQRQRLDKDAISSMVDSYINSCLSKTGGELQNVQKASLDYYNRTPFGHYDKTNVETANLGTNRSVYQSGDVFDAVEWATANIMKPFVVNDEIAEGNPVEPGDEKITQEQVDLLNYCFFKENPGFILLQTFIRDGNQVKIGVMKAFWDESIRVERESYENISEAQYIELLQDETVKEIKSQMHEEEGLDPFGVPTTTKTFDCTIERRYKADKVTIVNIPPEDFGILGSHNSISLKNAEFCYQRAFATREDLKNLGISAEKIAALPTQNARPDNIVTTARYYYPEQQTTLVSTPSTENYAMQKIELYECYLRYDSDGDGIAELHKILKVQGVPYLDDTIVSDIPFFAWTPLIQGHQFYGLSFADMAMQIEEIKSIVGRETLNNMYYSNIPMSAYDKTRITSANDLNSLLDREPGSCVGVDGPPMEAITFFPPAYSCDQSLQLFNYFDDLLQSRTGVGKMVAGLDTNILNNNKGDATANRIMSAAEERLGLVVKNLANSGLRDMLYYIIELHMRYCSQAKKFRLRNTYVEVDPRTWRAPMDITLRAGMGSGDKDKQISALSNVLQNYQMLYQAGGFGITFSQKNLHNTLTDLAKSFGIKYPDLYYQDPDSEEAKAFIAKQQEASKNQPPDIQSQVLMMQQQVEAGKLKIEEQKLQLQAQKQNQEYEIRMRELELKSMEAARMVNDSIEKNATERTKLELEYNTDVQGAVV